MAKKPSKKIKGKTKPSPKKKIVKPSQPVKTLNDYLQSFRWTWVLVIGLIFLIASIFLWDFLTFQKVLMFEGRVNSDAVNIFYPYSYMISEHIKSEGFPLWSFSTCMGMNIYPGGITWFLPNYLWLLFDSGNLHHLLVYKQVVLLLFTGVLFYWYLRTINLDKYTALIGGLLVCFSGYSLLGIIWSVHLGNVFRGALLLLAFEQAFLKKRYWFFTIPFLFLSNYSIYFFGTFIICYGLLRYFSVYGNNLKELFPIALKMMGYVLLGICMTAYSWATTIYKYTNSARVVGEANKSSELLEKSSNIFGDFSHNLTAALRLFSNDIFGVGTQYRGWANYLEAPSFYCGLITLLLLPQIFQFLNKRLRIIYGIYLSFWLLLVVFPPLRYAYYLYSGDFYKHALSVFIPLSLLFMALHALYHINKEGKVNFKLLIISLIIYLGILFFPYPGTTRDFLDQGLIGIIAVLLVLYTGILMAWQKPQLRMMAQISLIGLMIIEFGMMGRNSLSNMQPYKAEVFSSRSAFNDYTMEAIAHIKSIDPSFYRIAKAYTSGPNEHPSLNDAMVQGFYGSKGYMSQNNNHYIRFLKEAGMIEEINKTTAKWVNGIDPNSLLQGFGSMKYFIAKSDDDRYNKNFYNPVYSQNGIDVLQNKYNLPLGFCYDKVMSLEDFRSLKDENDRTSLGLFYGAVIEDTETMKKLNSLARLNLSEVGTPNFADIELKTKERSAKALQITEHSQSHIKGNITLEQSQLMFFSIPYHKGWRAVVDGKETELKRVNIGFMGVLLKQGTHEVELSYVPILFYESWVVFFIGLGIYLFLIWRFLKKGK